MKSTYETMGGKCQQDGDYFLHSLESPNIGVWGERRRKYLREHQKAPYTAMLLSDTLNTHLEEVDRTATEIYDRLTSQPAEQEGITEQLKTANQMKWIQRMNSIRHRASEIVRKELICV